MIGRQRGIALIAVLWVMTLLAAIAGAFMISTRTEVRVAQNLVGQAQARALADAGVQRAIAGLLAPESDRRWMADGRVYSWEFAGGHVDIAIEDEGGKVDLNAAPIEMLAGIFKAVGIPAPKAQALADAIADWRDEDELRRPDGAEDAEYRAAGLAHGTPDRPLEANEVLLNVLGVTPEIYQRVAPWVTVYSRGSGVNPATASRTALAAVPNITEADIDAIVAARNLDPRNASVALARFQVYARYLARPTANVYTVRAQGRHAGGAIFVREAVVRLGGDADRPFAFQAWRQGTRPFDVPAVGDTAAAPK
jgi:general secretion pathway protein K